MLDLTPTQDSAAAFRELAMEIKDAHKQVDFYAPAEIHRIYGILERFAERIVENLDLAGL